MSAARARDRLGRPPRPAEGGAARPADRRRSREHLRRRSALVRATPSAATRARALDDESRCACTGHPEGAPSRHRAPGSIASRLPDPTARAAACRTSSASTAAAALRATAAERRSRRRASAVAERSTARVASGTTSKPYRRRATVDWPWPARTRPKRSCFVRSGSARPIACSISTRSIAAGSARSPRVCARRSHASAGGSSRCRTSSSCSTRAAASWTP